MSFDAGFHTSIFFLLDAFSSVVEDVVLGFYNDLVAAAGKSQINGAAGVFLAFAECVSLNTDSHTDSDRFFLCDIDVFHFF